MSVGTAKAEQVGAALGKTVERRFAGVGVTTRSPSGVPEHMEVAEVGGLHITIEGNTWETVSTAQDAMLDGLDEMEIEWEQHKELTQQTPDHPFENHRIAIATEALTDDHISKLPWQLTADQETSVKLTGTRRSQTKTIESSRQLVFPLETLTDAQRDIFTRFLETRRDDEINVREPLWFALLLAGKRPATEITSFPPGTQLTVEDVATAFDLLYRRWSEHIIDVARTSWRLDLLPTQGEAIDTAAYHRRLGCFFGYPEQDVEYFISDTERTMPEDLVSEDIFQPEEIAYATFVPQGQVDSIAGYERAIETGKENRATITECADQWNLPALDAYADWVYHDARTDCLINV